MASNVFGNPVTDDTVRLIYPNVTQVTALHRAEVALQYMNGENGPTNVSNFVHTLKRAYGDGTSTLGMVYNATGGNVTFIAKNTWEGSPWQSPYPQIIQNGQWFGFLHVRDRLAGPSKEAIVYRGVNNAGFGRDWMLAWHTSRMNRQNRVYAEVRTAGAFVSTNWNAIDGMLQRQQNNYSTTTLGGFASGALGGGSSPELVGIFSLAGVGSSFLATASDVSVVFPSLDSKYVDKVDDDGADDEAPAEAPFVAC